MEFEERNKKPADSTKNLPITVLITLVSIVCLLLYIGWEMISDDASDIADLKVEAKAVRSQEPIEVMEDIQTEDEESEEEEDVTQAEEKEETKKETPKPAVTETPKKLMDAKTATHTVAANETLFSIAAKYNLKESTLKQYNSNVNANALKVGAKLDVPVQAIHTVGPGDILRVVGGKYGVTVEAIMKANGKTKNFAERGEKLKIPFKEKQ